MFSQHHHLQEGKMTHELLLSNQKINIGISLYSHIQNTGNFIKENVRDCWINQAESGDVRRAVAC